jgi:hypothetical protein
VPVMLLMSNVKYRASSFVVITGVVCDHALVTRRILLE